jgi:hypothetical protein
VETSNQMGNLMYTVRIYLNLPGATSSQTSHHTHNISSSYIIFSIFLSVPLAILLFFCFIVYSCIPFLLVVPTLNCLSPSVTSIWTIQNREEENVAIQKVATMLFASLRWNQHSVLLLSNGLQDKILGTTTSPNSFNFS